MQAWGSFTFGWSGRDRVGYGVEVEPKVLVVVPEGEPDWATLDITPSADRAVKPWLDLVGELATGYTSQTDDLKSYEVSPRTGARFHVFSRDLSAPVRLPDRPSRRRVVVRDLVRVESQKPVLQRRQGEQLHVALPQPHRAASCRSRRRRFPTMVRGT